jgi:tetratricopeptide (TPR) repeat protein
MNATPKRPGRNAPCTCGSGRKFKRCCAPELRQASSLPVSTTAGRRDPALRCWRRAIRLREAGRPAASVRQLQRAAAMAPANARFQADLGVALAVCQHLEEAVLHFRRAIDLQPAMAHAHFGLGATLLDLGREAAALGPLQRAAALTPNVPELQRMLAGLLADWGRLKPAAAAFRAAAAAAAVAAPVQALCDTASALLLDGRGEDAKAALLRAQALDREDLRVAKMLGRSYSEEGRFSDAERQFRSVLARDPRDADAAYALFQVIRACEADRPLLATLASYATRPEVSPGARMMLGFALGQAYDQLGEYAEAMRHFETANAIRAAIAPLDRAALVRDTERVIAAFPPDSLVPGAAEPKHVDERAVFVVGLPRSGTTLVEQILSSHPRVAAGGEIAFWTAHGLAAIDQGASDAVLAPLVAAYLALFDRIDPSAMRIVDKNPFNFFRLGLLRRALPLARIVHVRRLPIDNALSLHTTCLSPRNNFFFGSREDLLFYYDVYVRVMEHWRAVLPRERFFELDYEALVEDREAQTRRLVEFCGLDWDEACMRPERNDRVISTASVWQARQPVYRRAVGRWRNYAPWLGSLMRLAPAEEDRVG